MTESVNAPSFGSAHPMPMTFGQIFDRTYRLMRANLRLFLGIAAVPSAAVFLVLASLFPLMLLQIGPQLAHKTAAPPVFPVYLMAILPCVYLILTLVYALYLPAASYAVTQADLGVAVTFREAYSVGWRRFGRYLWLMILGSLYIIVPVLACALIVGLGALLLHFATGGNSGDYAALLLIPLGVLLYVAATVYSVLIALRFSLAYPACVVEGLPAWPSLQRSALLTKGAKGRIFLVLLVVYALTYAVSLASMAVFFVVGALAALAAMLAHVTAGSPAFVVLICLAVLGYLLMLIACCLFSYAAFTTALAVLYHDQWLRKDGPLSAPTPSGELV